METHNLYAHQKFRKFEIKIEKKKYLISCACTVTLKATPTLLSCSSATLDILVPPSRTATTGCATSGESKVSSDELSPPLPVKRIPPGTNGSSNKSSNVTPPMWVGLVIVSMATGFGIPDKSGSSSLEDESESSEKSLRDFLFSACDCLALVFDLASGAAVLAKGAVVKGTLLSNGEVEPFDGFVVFLFREGEDLLEDTFGGCTMASLSESSLLLVENSSVSSLNTEETVCLGEGHCVNKLVLFLVTLAALVL